MTTDQCNAPASATPPGATAMRAVLDRLFAFVGVFACDGTVVEANEAPLKAAGISFADVVGRKFWDCYWWSYSEKSQARLAAAVQRAAAGETVRYDALIRTAGDARMWIDFQLAPLLEGDRVSRLVGCAADISERKYGELHAQCLEKLYPRCMLADDPDKLLACTLRTLAAHLNVEHAAFTEYLPDTASIKVQRERADGSSTATATYRVSDFVDDQAVAALTSGRELVISDVTTDVRSAGRATNFSARGVRAVAVVPCFAASGLKAAVSIASSTARQWRPDEIRLLRQVAGTLFPAVEHARSEELLRESEQRFRTTFESMPIGMAHVTLDGAWLRVNQRLCRILGHPPEALLGRSVTEFAHPHDVAAFRAIALEVASGAVSRATVERRCLRSDGSAAWIDVTVSMLHDSRERAVCFTVAIEDVTERKNAEEALRAADRRKDEFLATLAHELRNPLAPIRNAVQILNLQAPRDATAQAARNIIERQLQHMVHLVDDLLDASRITRGKLQLRRGPTTLMTIMEQALEIVRPDIEKMGHQLTLAWPPAPLHLDADAVRLAQVFSNLLDNARKYTPPGGHIWVRAERDNHEVVVTVRDNGIGIAADHLPHLFDMFSRAGSSIDHAHDGLGIGLALAKGIVELHDGSLQASSDGPGKGSTFIVRLPIRRDEPGGTETQDQRAVLDITGYRILVADDNRDSTVSLARLLEMSGNVVETAYDGAEAVEKASAFKPQIVLLDLGMPRMTGYQACRAIRARPSGRSAIVLALTGWGTEHDRRETRAAGFDGHLVKPLDYQELHRLLAALTRRDTTPQ